MPRRGNKTRWRDFPALFAQSALNYFRFLLYSWTSLIKRKLKRSRSTDKRKKAPHKKRKRKISSQTEEKRRHLLEQKNQSHRHFVSYVFHEVRIPFQVVILDISKLEIMILTDLREEIAATVIGRRFPTHTSQNIKSKLTTGDNGMPIIDDIKAATSTVERILDSALALRTNDALMSAFTHQNLHNQPDIIDTVHLDGVLCIQRIEADKFRIEQKPCLMSRDCKQWKRGCGPGNHEGGAVSRTATQQ
jgi:hypothetical protein